MMKQKIKISSVLLLHFFCLPLFILGQESLSIYKINGAIDSKYDGQSIMLFTFDSDTIRSVDTTYVQNGKFHFSGKEYIDDFSLLSLGNYPDTVISLDLILEKGNLDVSIGNPSKVEGSYIYDSYKSYSALFLSFDRECKLIMDNESINEREKRERRNSLFDTLEKNIFDKMVENASNIVGTYIFKDYIHNMPDKYFDELSEIYREKIEHDVSMQQSIASRNKLKGTQYSDFELQTIEGKTKKISDYVGKSEYLFIDFWASWCGPCIADIPHVKSAYEKYKDKGLSILGISLDVTKKSWIGALSRIDAPWDHLIADKGMDSEIAKYYNISAIPFALLIDKNGSTIEVKLSGQNLELVMERLLKEKEDK